MLYNANESEYGYQEDKESSGEAYGPNARRSIIKLKIGHDVGHDEERIRCKLQKLVVTDSFRSF